MNFGQNLYNWFLSNAQSLVLLAIVVIGLYLGFKREFSKLKTNRKRVHLSRTGKSYSQS